MVLAAQPWHFWLGVAVVLGAVIPALLALIVGYLKSVTSTRYPKGSD